MTEPLSRAVHGNPSTANGRRTANDYRADVLLEGAKRGCRSAAGSEEVESWKIIRQLSECNYSPRVGWSGVGCLGGGYCQGVADGIESAAAVSAAGFDN
jgi:hypothetical protein